MVDLRMAQKCQMEMGHVNAPVYALTTVVDYPFTK